MVCLGCSSRIQWPAFLMTNDGYVCGDEFGLVAEWSAEGVVAAYAEDWHRQPGPGESGEVFGGLGPRCEVGPGGVHFSGARVSGGVDLTVWFWDGVGLVIGEVVPEVLEVSSLAAFDEGFGGGAVEAEVPVVWVVVDGFPALDTGEEGVHEDELFDLGGIHCGVGVGDHETDVVAYYFCLLDSEGF